MRETFSPDFFTISPEFASISPVRTLRSVLLPSPLRPTRQMRSPGSMSNDTLSKSGGPPKRSRIFCAERMGINAKLKKFLHGTYQGISLAVI